MTMIQELTGEVMIRIGYQVPGRQSAFIHRYEPGSNSVLVESGDMGRVNRYLFTASSVEELRTVVIPFVLCRLVGLLQVGLRFVIALKPNTPSLPPARQRLLEKRYVDSGWLLHDGGSFRAWTGPASIKIDNFASEAFMRKAAFLLLLNTNSNDALPHAAVEFLAKPLCACSAMLSDECLNLIGGNMIGLAYLQYDDSIRPGMIILTEEVLDQHVFEDMDAENVEVFYNEEADRVWQL